MEKNEVKIILDTHIFLWVLTNSKKLTEKKRLEIESLANTIYISAISISEIMIKSSLGKLDVQFDPIEMVKKSGFESLNFTSEDAVLLKELPFHHRDPFDRMLICQSKANKMYIMSEDEKFNNYDCKLI